MNTSIDKATFLYEANRSNYDVDIGGKRIKGSEYLDPKAANDPNKKVTLSDGREVPGFEHEEAIVTFKRLPNDQVVIEVHAKDTKTDLNTFQFTVEHGALSKVRQVVTDKDGKIKDITRFRINNPKIQKGEFKLNEAIENLDPKAKKKTLQDGKNEHGYYQLNAYTRSQWVRDLCRAEKNDKDYTYGPRHYKLTREDLENASEPNKKALTALVNELNGKSTRKRPKDQVYIDISDILNKISQEKKAKSSTSSPPIEPKEVEPKKTSTTTPLLTQDAQLSAFKETFGSEKPWCKNPAGQTLRSAAQEAYTFIDERKKSRPVLDGTLRLALDKMAGMEEVLRSAKDPKNPLYWREEAIRTELENIGRELENCKPEFTFVTGERKKLLNALQKDWQGFVDSTCKELKTLNEDQSLRSQKNLVYVETLGQHQKEKLVKPLKGLLDTLPTDRKDLHGKLAQDYAQRKQELQERLSKVSNELDQTLIDFSQQSKINASRDTLHAEFEPKISSTERELMAIKSDCDKLIKECNENVKENVNSKNKTLKSLDESLTNLRAQLPKTKDVTFPLEEKGPTYQAIQKSREFMIEFVKTSDENVSNFKKEIENLKNLSVGRLVDFEENADKVRRDIKALTEESSQVKKMASLYQQIDHLNLKLYELIDAAEKLPNTSRGILAIYQDNQNNRFNPLKAELDGVPKESRLDALDKLKKKLEIIATTKNKADIQDEITEISNEVSAISAKKVLTEQEIVIKANKALGNAFLNLNADFINLEAVQTLYSKDLDELSKATESNNAESIGTAVHSSYLNLDRFVEAEKEFSKFQTKIAKNGAVEEMINWLKKDPIGVEKQESGQLKSALEEAMAKGNSYSKGEVDSVTILKDNYKNINDELDSLYKTYLKFKARNPLS